MTYLSMFYHEIQKLSTINYFKYRHDMDECIQIYIQMLQYEFGTNMYQFCFVILSVCWFLSLSYNTFLNSSDYVQLKYMLA